MATRVTHDTSLRIRHLPFSYEHENSRESALGLIYKLYPHWQTDPGEVEVVPFTGGVMNTLLKITRVASKVSRDKLLNTEQAVLLRSYGTGSDILIDRDREATTHALLAEQGLAAPLLARFNNGLLYKFLPGRVCTTLDLQKESVYRAVAARLGEWHSKLPLPIVDTTKVQEEDCNLESIVSANIWTMVDSWLSALPARNSDEEVRNVSLRAEFERFSAKLRPNPSEGAENFILGHCDLLSANIIISPDDQDTSATDSSNSFQGSINFIDYEYAVPCPAAFDLANHLSEWGGFECDYSLLPTRATRRDFVEEYVKSYSQNAPLKSTPAVAVEQLLADIDQYRGMPGFYWGIHALIQSAISDVKFDWISYSELRLQEYWAWSQEVDGSRAQRGEQMPLREQRWAQDT